MDSRKLSEKQAQKMKEKNKMEQNCISKDATDSLLCSSELFLYTSWKIELESKYTFIPNVVPISEIFI